MELWLAWNSLYSSHWTRSTQIQLACLASKLQGPTNLCHLRVGITGTSPHPAFYRGVQDPNQDWTFAREALSAWDFSPSYCAFFPALSVLIIEKKAKIPYLVTNFNRNLFHNLLWIWVVAFSNGIGFFYNSRKASLPYQAMSAINSGTAHLVSLRHD